MPTITGIHHLELTVRDMAASEAFYEKVFGFTRVMGAPDEGGKGAKSVLYHAESRTILGLTTHSANDGTAFSEFATGLDHLSFGVAGREELDAWAAALDGMGIARGEIGTTPVGDLLSFRDPDNIQIELWADPPKK